MKLTFIGLGKMGFAISTSLLKSGHELTVFNRTSSKMEPLIKMGAKGASSIEEAVKESDVVFSCLLDDDAALEATKEIAKHILKEAIHVNCATILPATAEKLLEIHKNNHGIYLAATVLGIPQAAIDKTMTAFCSGDATGFKNIEELFEAFTSKVVYLGENIKAANIMKICMNYSLTTAIELISELYTFAEKSGMDKELVKIGLHKIYGHKAYKLYIDKIYARDFDQANFTVTGGHKDVRLFQEAFKSVGAPSELANVARKRYIEAESKGFKDKDWSCLYEIVRNEANLTD